MDYRELGISNFFRGTGTVGEICQRTAGNICRQLKASSHHRHLEYRRVVFHWGGSIVRGNFMLVSCISLVLDVLPWLYSNSLLNQLVRRGVLVVLGVFQMIVPIRGLDLDILF